MKIKFVPRLARTLLGAALLTAFGSVAAGEAHINKTKLKFKHGETVETISFEGQLTVGQSIGLYSEAGTPVTVSRTEAGLKVEFPDKTHEVPYHDPSADGGPGERKVVIIKREGHGDGEEMAWHDSENDPELQAAIDEALAEAGTEGGTKKVIIKHIEHKEVSDESGTN